MTKMASVDDITEAMKDVIDPELGINVIDLGLVYDLRIDEGNVAILDMTLTSAACPLQDVIEDQTRSVLQDLTSDVKIKVNSFLLNSLSPCVCDNNGDIGE